MGWLTVQPKRATITTTPIDRLATSITRAIMEGRRSWRCDRCHTASFRLTLFQQRLTAYPVPDEPLKMFCLPGLSICLRLPLFRRHRPNADSQSLRHGNHASVQRRFRRAGIALAGESAGQKWAARNKERMGRQGDSAL